ncbi:MAG TPA: glycosyltransferase family 9 protein [Oligoflexus sp.]|uniref:glycosyltransferase family 9 protein n=1 Tax=Oligoflexus sp. TaxID=1971216 RepID=UPI002D423DC2|nr:glycosyltransferase family 9 protein [Oligoflexus sp.]HYX39318.1 glycosyltransferase family 9 protein [Oligoflexus sp.]
MFTPSATSPVMKLALYRSTSIGDVVLATACVDLLRQIPAPVQITWVGRKPALQLIGSAFPEIKTVEVDPDITNYQEKVLQELKDIHFVVDLQTNLRSQLLCRSLKRDYKIPSYVCYKRTIDRGTMTISSRLRGRRRALPESYVSTSMHQFDMMTSALRQALEVHLPVEMMDGLDKIKAHPLLPTAHDPGQKPWQKELKFGHWLAVAPGAAHEAKKAPSNLLRDTLELLNRHLRQDPAMREQPTGLLFVGNDKDRDSALGILDSIDWPGPILNLAGKLSLWETALALKDTDGLLCNDSGLLHIAEAVGTPVAALFGPTVEAFGFPPWRPESKAFSSLLGCRPCSKHGQTDCRFGDKLCFGLIQPPHIVDHLKTLLKRNVANGSH